MAEIGVVMKDEKSASLFAHGNIFRFTQRTQRFLRGQLGMVASNHPPTS
jgi:hypothetical protein